MSAPDFTRRQRTTIACINCRKRKVKCNGARPCCRHCLQVHDDCKWPVLEVEAEPSSQLRLSKDDLTSPSTKVDLLSVPQARHLFDIFFNKSHLFFIRQSFHQPSFDPVEIQSERPFLFAAVCSVAALYVTDASILDVFNGETATKLSHRLAKTAQSYSRFTSDRPSLSSVQGNIVLSFRELCCRNTTHAWMYAGHAIRMTQELRLGKEYFHELSPREREIRRRTFWTCFVMDRMLCFLTARPQVFRSRHVSVQLPCPDRSFLFDEAHKGPGLADFDSSTYENAEVLPFFLRAVDLWAVMIDLFGTVGNTSPQGFTEDEEEFYKAHNAVLKWVGNLPSRMKWSMSNYRIFRMLGEGSLFVSMHMALNHALCTLQQAHLPQGVQFLPESPLNDGWKQEIAATCCLHANLISQMICDLVSGDDADREALRSPFTGAAIVSSACVQIWSITSSSSTPDVDVSSDRHSITKLTDVLKSWQDRWPIAISWVEIVELISLLYTVAYSNDGATAADAGPRSEDEATVGHAALPEPSNVSPRLFEKIRHIMFTISEPSTLRQVQSRLHIRDLWNHMSLQAQMTSISQPFTSTSPDFPFQPEMDESPGIPFGWGQYLNALDGT